MLRALGEAMTDLLGVGADAVEAEQHQEDGKTGIDGRGIINLRLH
jgi:hypothetical protein